MPAASIARTLNLCLPWSRRLTFVGEVQGLNAFWSSLHSKVESGSDELNLNLTLFLSVLFGAPLVILVSGGWCRAGWSGGRIGRVARRRQRRPPVVEAADEALG